MDFPKRSPLGLSADYRDGDRESFMETLDTMETKCRQELSRLADVKTRKEPFWMFHWLNETRNVVYSIQPTHDPNDEMVFQARDEHLSDALRKQFLEKLWPH